MRFKKLTAAVLGAAVLAASIVPEAALAAYVPVVGTVTNCDANGTPYVTHTTPEVDTRTGTYFGSNTYTYNTTISVDYTKSGKKRSVNTVRSYSEEGYFPGIGSEHTSFKNTDTEITTYNWKKNYLISEVMASSTVTDSDGEITQDAVNNTTVYTMNMKKKRIKTASSYVDNRLVYYTVFKNAKKKAKKSKKMKATFITYNMAAGGIYRTGTVYYDKKNRIKKVEAYYPTDGSHETLTRKYYSNGNLKNSSKVTTSALGVVTDQETLAFNEAGFPLSRVTVGSYVAGEGATATLQSYNITITYNYVQYYNEDCPQVVQEYQNGVLSTIYTFTQFKNVTKRRNCDALGNYVSLLIQQQELEATL